MISSTLGQLERGFIFPLIEFIVNIFEYSVFSLVMARWPILSRQLTVVFVRIVVWALGGTLAR